MRAHLVNSRRGRRSALADSSKRDAGPLPAIRCALRCAGIALALAASVLTAPSAGAAQTNPTSCSYPGRSIPVYFNPANISANGFDPNAFRNTMLNALAVWNEESRGDIDMYYAGDTTVTTNIPGGILVQFWNTLGTCTMPGQGWDAVLANTGIPAGSDCSTTGGAMSVGLRSVCTGIARPWVTTWATPSQFQLEGVLVHELGHAMSHAHSAIADSVMVPAYTTTAGNLHLYPIDENTVVGREGTTARHAGTLQSGLGTLWGPVSTSVARSTSTSPAIAIGTTTTTPFRLGIWNAITLAEEVSLGNHGAWGSVSAVPQPESVTEWVSLSTSSFGELLAAWPSACHNTSAHCVIRTAWSNNGGASWTSVDVPTTATAGTFGRVAVSYDAFRDRFVAAYLDANSGRIFTSSAFAGSAPGWTTPIAASMSSGSEDHFRYMGGLVFDGAGGGLLTAGFFNLIGGSTPFSDPGVIVQMSVSSTLLGDYTLGWAQFANPADPVGMTTRRHFGLARSTSTSRIVLGYRSFTGGRPFTIGIKSSIASTTAFTGPTDIVAGAVNSVDVGWSPFGGSAPFLAGVSWL
jgi:hypothetical protein